MKKYFVTKHKELWDNMDNDSYNYINIGDSCPEPLSSRVFNNYDEALSFFENLELDYKNDKEGLLFEEKVLLEFDDLKISNNSIKKAFYNNETDSIKIIVKQSSYQKPNN